MKKEKYRLEIAKVKGLKGKKFYIVRNEEMAVVRFFSFVIRKRFHTFIPVSSEKIITDKFGILIRKQYKCKCCGYRTEKIYSKDAGFHLSDKFAKKLLKEISIK